MNNKALFIGLTTLDIQFVTEEYPEPNQKIKTDMPIIVAGGPAANAAITYSFLGGEVDFLTCIGKHIFTDIIYNDFDEHSVNVIDAIRDKNADPIVSAVITTTSNGDRTIFTHYPDRLEVGQAYKKILNNISGYDFIFTDGFYPELFHEIGLAAKEFQKPVIFDGGSWKPHFQAMLPLIDIAICSSNFHPPGTLSTTDIFVFLQDQGIKQMAISRGGESIVLPNGHVGVESTTAIDTLGAGDVLHGAFCFYYQQNNDFVASLRLASDVATFSTKYIGTREWMKKYKKLSAI